MANSRGIGVVGVTFIVFLILKLTNVIHWSWWWVTSPLWISAGIGIFAVIIMLIFGVFIFAFRDKRKGNW